MSTPIDHLRLINSIPTMIAAADSLRIDLWEGLVSTVHRCQFLLSPNPSDQASNSRS